MSRKKAAVGGLETTVGAGLLGVLVLIAVFVFSAQFRFNPAVVPARFETPVEAHSGWAGPDPVAILPEKLSVMGPPEYFSAENLSDKINGKADFYLKAGFQRLRAQRLSLKAESGQWLEALVFDMATPEQAFAAFSGQQRVGARRLDSDGLSVLAENAVFMVTGRYYLELVASDLSEELETVLVALAAGLAGSKPQAAGRFSKLELLPPEGQIEGSISLLASDAFGFGGWKDVVVAEYRLGQETATAFVVELGNAEEAAATAQAFMGFLAENGGEEVAVETSIPGARAAGLFGFFDLVFTSDVYVAGVHQAPDLSTAEQLATAVKRRLTGSGRRP